MLSSQSGIYLSSRALNAAISAELCLHACYLKDNGRNVTGLHFLCVVVCSNVWLVIPRYHCLSGVFCSMVQLPVLWYCSAWLRLKLILE